MRYYKYIKKEGGEMGFTMKLREIISYLESLGYVQEEGGKHKIKMVKGSKSIAVPSHTCDLAKGTVTAILKQAGSNTGAAKKWKERG